jgi:hypothetical protein
LNLVWSFSLTVDGSEQLPVVLEGYQGAVWGGLRTNGPFNALIDMSWCEIRHAAPSIQYEAGYKLTNEQVSISDCTIDASAGQQGIYLAEGITGSRTCVFDISRTTVVASGGNGIDVSTVGGADMVTIADCVVSDCGGAGLRALGAVTASRIVAHGNGVGVYTTGTLLESEVFNNGRGISFASGVVENCDIHSNTLYGVYVLGGDGRVNGCRIHGNGQYDAYCDASVIPFTTIDMRDNYWGEVTTAEMQAEGTFSDIEAIFDWWDDSSKSLVDFEGFIVPPTSAGSSVETASWASVKARYR